MNPWFDLLIVWKFPYLYLLISCKLTLTYEVFDQRSVMLEIAHILMSKKHHFLPAIVLSCVGFLNVHMSGSL